MCRALEATGDMAGTRAAAAKVKELLRERVVRRMGGDPSAGSAQSDEWMGTDATTHLTPDEIGALFFAAKVLMRS